MQPTEKQLERFTQQIESIAKSKVLYVDYNGGDWMVAIDSELGALRVFHKYHHCNGVRLGKSATGGWYVAIGK